MKNEDSKVRLLAVQMFLSTGEKLTTRQIQEKLLKRFDITADRKTIYDDICAINRLIPIEALSGRNGGYRIVDICGKCNSEK